MRAALTPLHLAFGAFVVAVYLGASLYMGGLGFEPVKDEEQFWEQITTFVEIWPPSIAELQNYDEPMTPLSFLFWAGLETLHGQGIAMARFMSILIGMGLLALIACRETSPRTAPHTPLLAALALMAFPYWIPLSLLLYTDLPAAVFVVLGSLFYARDRNLLSAFFFVLAISTRQYMVVFPAAIVADQLWGVIRRRRPLELERLLPALAAMASLVGWILFFGGVGPADGLAEWPRHQNALERLNLSFSLYFLAATGAYFVLPEWAIDRFPTDSKLRLDGRALAGCGLLLVAFWIDAPNFPKEIGPLNRSIAWVLNPTPVADIVRPALMFLLASATVARFSQFDLATWVVLANACLMAFMWSPWEKYLLPMLAALWMWKALGAIEREADPTLEARAAEPTR